LSGGTQIELAEHAALRGRISMSEVMANEIARIYDRARQELVTLLESQPPPTLTPTSTLPEWMSATQLADYWHLHNDKGEPTVAGILKWSKRPTDQFPLPHAYMGDLLRFNRDEANQWAREEAERRRVQSQKRRLKIA
jgi:hypothetical protein